ncbi:MAG: hypothetical protein GY772_29420 [bacterium]|nr:hypothetical protein [bacterium]
MRRPLFDTGLPRKLSGASAWDTVLTLEDMDPGLQSRVRGLTLYLLKPSGGVGQTVRVQAEDLDSGQTVELYAQPFGAGNVQSVQLLDRYPLRGNVRVQVGASGDAATSPVYACGYYQIEGERTIPIEYRPLQPMLRLVDPNYIASEQDGAGVTKLHAFDPRYIDVLRFWSGGTGTAPAIVIADGNEAIEIPFETGGSVGLLLPGISFRPASDAEVSGFAPGIYLKGGADPGRMIGWGMFIRS